VNHSGVKKGLHFAKTDALKERKGGEGTGGFWDRVTRGIKLIAQGIGR